MSDLDWHRVEAVFQEAADLPATERSSFLDGACSGDAVLRREVEDLLRASDRGSKSLIGLVDVTAATLEEPASLGAGARLGAYRVLREIGRGGMGAVYLAVRDDDEYQKQVAIKVVKRGMDTDFVLARFRHERQILANLQHPNIAGLFDGGTTQDGLPFLVMEYVDGQTIDVYVRERALSVEDVCRLMRKVGNAVSYAHRNLVVHRDLKPSNIFVTAEGEPKLLDFGIAKILEQDPEGASMTQAGGWRMLTPEYASPEQIRGEAVTTASDVYSLGAILFELLTGERMRRFQTRTPVEISREVCENDPPRLSTRMHRRISTDLENVVSLALDRDLSRRYVSVDQFSEDLRRWLDHERVQAHGPGLLYTLGKFVQRNRVAVTAMALLVLSLVGGIVGMTWEARREQRRFQQVRQLANKFLFDFHDAIRDLPGSTPARRLVVKTALQYLDSLNTEARGDRQLQSELAAAYDRIGDVQGNPYYPNIGDTQGAYDSYGKAYAIRNSLPVDSPAAARDLALCHAKLGDVLVDLGRRKDAVEEYRKGETIVTGALKQYPNDALLLDGEAKVRLRWGDTQREIGEVQGALDNYQRSEKIFEELSSRYPDVKKYRSDQALSARKVGAVLTRMQHFRAALDSRLRALKIHQGLLESEPENTRYLRECLSSLQNAGDMYILEQSATNEEAKSLFDPERALVLYRRALELAERVRRPDPENRQAQTDAGIAHSRLGDAYLAMHRYREAQQAYTEALMMHRRAQASAPGSNFLTFMAADSERALARALFDDGQLALAAEHFQSVISSCHALLQKDPNYLTAAETDLHAEEYMVRIELRRGATAQAKLRVQQVARFAAPFREKDPAFPELLDEMQALIRGH